MNPEKAGLRLNNSKAVRCLKSNGRITAHFMVAIWYCTSYPLPDAVQKIRTGIKQYNVSVGGQNTDSAGYHETITLFYTTVIAQYLVAGNITTLTDSEISIFLQQPFLEKDYLLRFYTRELLLSPAARRNWMPPDICPAGKALLFAYFS